MRAIAYAWPVDCLWQDRVPENVSRMVYLLAVGYAGDLAEGALPLWASQALAEPHQRTEPMSSEHMMETLSRLFLTPAITPDAVANVVFDIVEAVRRVAVRRRRPHGGAGYERTEAGQAILASALERGGGADEEEEGEVRY